MNKMFAGAVMILAVGSSPAGEGMKTTSTKPNGPFDSTVLYCNKHVTSKDYNITMEPGNISVVPKTK